MASGTPLGSSEDPADCPVGVRVCMKVTRCIGDDWKWLGRAMGIEDAQLDSIKEENRSKGAEEMANKVLNLWKKEMAKGATVRALYDLLVDVERPELADEILAIAYKSTTKSMPAPRCEKTQTAPEKIGRLLASHPAGSFYNANTFGDGATVSAPLAGRDLYHHEHIHHAPDQPLSEEEQIHLWKSFQASLQRKHKKLHIPSMPWLEDWELKFEHYYVELAIKSKEDEETCDLNLHDIFQAGYGETPKRVLIEGPAGYGKTTLAMKLCYDHSKREEYIKKFDAVILLHLRHFENTLKDLIINTLNFKDFKPEHISTAIKLNQSKCLFILDGLDELPQEKLGHIIPLLKGEELPEATVIVTSRAGCISLKSNEAESPVINILRYMDSRIAIKGLEGENRIRFLKTYLQSNPEKLISILALVASKFEQLFSTDLFDCPLYLLIFVVVVEESDVSSIGTKTELYKTLFNFILRRMFAKKGVTDQEWNLFDFNRDNPPAHVQMLSQFGLLALQSLLNSQYLFTADEIHLMCGDDEILKLGILKQNDSKLGLKRTSWFEPLHLSFLEFSAAYHCCVNVMLLLKREVFFNTQDLMKLSTFHRHLKLIIPFFFGLCGKDLITGSSILWNGFLGKEWLFVFIGTLDVTEIEIESQQTLSVLGKIFMPFVPEVLYLQYVHWTKSALICETLSQALRINQLKRLVLNVACSVNCCEVDSDLLGVDPKRKTQEECKALLQGCGEIITQQSLFIKESESVCNLEFTLCQADLDEQLKWLSNWMLINQLPIHKPIHKIVYSCSKAALTKALTKLDDLICSEKIKSLKIDSRYDLPTLQWKQLITNANISQQLVDISVYSRGLLPFPLLSGFNEKKWRSIEIKNNNIIPFVAQCDPNSSKYSFLFSFLKQLQSAEQESFIHDLPSSVQRIGIRKHYTSDGRMFHEAETFNTAEYVFVQSDSSAMMDNLRELCMHVNNSKCFQVWNWAYLGNLQVLVINIADNFKSDEQKDFISGLLYMLPNCHPALRLELLNGCSADCIGNFVEQLHDSKRSTMGYGEQKTPYRLHTLLLGEGMQRDFGDFKRLVEKLESILEDSKMTAESSTTEAERFTAQSQAYIGMKTFLKTDTKFTALGALLKIVMNGLPKSIQESYGLTTESYVINAEILDLIRSLVGRPTKLSGKTMKLLKESLLFGNICQLWLCGRFCAEGYANRELVNLFTSAEGFKCEPCTRAEQANHWPVHPCDPNYCIKISTSM